MKLSSSCVDLSALPHDNRLVGPWNDLWARSAATVPVARAEHLANWQTHFDPGASMKAVVVERDGQWLAALPFVTDRIGRLVPIARMPWNEWAWGADLLVDESRGDVPLLLDELVAGIRRLPERLAWIDAAPIATPRWSEFMRAAGRTGCQMSTVPRFEIGQVVLRGEGAIGGWDDYRRGWSKNLRHQMSKVERRAAAMGGIALTIPRPADMAEVDQLMVQCLKIEHDGWKGRRGSSIMSHPHIASFFLDQAQLLNRDGFLKLVLLVHEEQPIAFEYGWRSKAVYFSPKIGYDERFATLSPGQLLRARHMEIMCSDPSISLMDFLGAETETTSRWASRRYPVARIVLSTRAAGGSTLMRVGRTCGPPLIAWRKRLAATLHAKGRHSDGSRGAPGGN